MGRRSSHTADELRELILAAATELIDETGLSGFSARAIARRIGYSAGTLYNVFSDLDELILTVELRLLDQLAHRLADVPKSADPVRHLCDLGAAYFAFTQEQPRLWNLLLEHHMPTGWQVPPQFQARLEAVSHEVERAIAPLAGSEDAVQLNRSARVLWAAIHGITSLATAEKLTNVNPENAGLLVDDLVRTYAGGLIASRPSAKLRSK